MKCCFWVNNFNKGKHVYRACASALSQTYPCDVLFTDNQSTDGSWDEILRAINEAPRGAEHKVRALKTPFQGFNTFKSFGEHWMWAIDQTDADWVLQCSSDDYSLPERAKVCMQAVERHPCVAVGALQRFFDPQKTDEIAESNFGESSYVRAGWGLRNLVFGSCIGGYNREWNKKVGAFTCTPDVYYGYLAALDKGYYMVNSVQHVHHKAYDEENLGFEGKMRGAELRGDQETMTRLNELNRFQLYGLYFRCAARASELYPLSNADDKNAVIQSMIDQSIGWFQEREKMHVNKWMPGIL